jgi:hypothetical protein
VDSLAGSAQLSWGPPTDDGGKPITSYEVLVAGTVVTTTAGTSATVTGLTRGTSPTLGVRGVNSVGHGATASRAAVVIGAPGAPSGVTATTSAGAAVAAWGNPDGYPAALLTGWLVTPVVDGVAGSPVPLPSDRVGYGLPTAAGSHVRFEVVAVSGALTGPPGSSNEVVVTTVPGPPGVGRATGGHPGGRSTARITWTAPTLTGGLPVTGYRVLVMRVKHGRVVTTTTSSTLPAGRTTYTARLKAASYRFAVVALNGLGESTQSAASNTVRAR